MANPKKQWFDVKDSLTKKETGAGFYYNVEARFSDHPVIDVERSKLARKNVYNWSIVLHMRVKRSALGGAAQKNMTSHVMRFDKGDKMDGTDFHAAKAAIMRCWDAWEYYQTFREAPVTDQEEKALELISHQPLAALGTLNGSSDDDDDDEDADFPMVAAERAAAPARREARQRAMRKPRSAA